VNSALGVLKMSIDVLCRRAVLEVEDLRIAIDSVRPDAVIVDANCWGAMSFAESAGIPWLVFSPFSPYLRARGVPPFGPGLRPLPGIVGEVRDASVRPFVRYLFDRPIVPRVNAVRAELGGARGQQCRRSDAARAAAVGGRRGTVRVSACRVG
jgi:hypothetical protein